MNTTIAIVLGCLVGAVIILLLPWVFKDRKRKRLTGPDLSELQYTEVEFKNGDLQLAGMLFLPEGAGPFPSVVFIHGSGTSARNSPWYLAVAQHLQQNGIAVLLPDKRGSEKSGGDWKKATLQDFAQDASSAVQFIQCQAEFTYSAIGVMGFSQGGWVAPIVASEDKDVAFAVSLSGAGVSVADQIRYQTVTDIAGYGTYRFLAKLLAPLIAKSIMKKDYCRMLVGFDPLPYWQKVTVPSFVAYGENDKAVPVPESVRRIEALGNANITVKVYPDGGHAIAEPASLGIYHMQEAFLRDLVDFINNSVHHR
ncbi:MAG: alpha/beta fold hydrolase [Anaerolineales bacterium]|nr:alpha/beta fold hydrolase [Anaerolineales bacterium]